MNTDILEVFGLQILLEDKASATAQQVGQSLQKLGIEVGNIEKQIYGSFQRMESIMHSGFQINIWGGRIMSIGKAMSSLFGGLGQQVVSIGGEFEKQRIKLNNLYKDAIRGEEAFQYSVQQALLTPFDVQDYVTAVAGLKVSGIDPMKQYFNEKTGEMQDMVQFAGDLAGAYGKNMFDAFFSLKEAIAGNDWRSLRHRFDGLSKGVIEAATGLTMSTEQSQAGIQQRAEVMAKFIGQEYGGMMRELGLTFTGLLNRAKENIQILLMWIGDAGFFKAIKNEMEQIITIIEGGQHKLRQFAQVTSDALTYMLKPISYAIKLGVKMIDVFVDFANQHPKLARVIATMVTFTGAIVILLGAVTAVSGSMITMIASLATLALNMRLSHGSTKLTALLFQGFGKIVVRLTTGLAKFTLGTALFATAWKNNMGGIRDGFKYITETFGRAYNLFNDFLLNPNLSEFRVYVEGMEEIDNAATRLALKFAKVYYIFKGFFDYLDDGTVLKDTVQRLEELGALGFLESLIRAEIAIRSVTEGVSQFVVGAWNVIKPILDAVVSTFEYVQGFFNNIFNRSSSPITDLQAEFTGKQSFGWAQNLGKVLGFVIASTMSIRLGQFVTGTLAKISGMNRMLKNAYVTSRGIEVGSDMLMWAKMPSFITRRNKNGVSDAKNMSGLKEITWRNLFLNKLGTMEEKQQGRLLGLQNRRRRLTAWFAAKQVAGHNILKKEVALTSKAYNMGRKGMTGMLVGTTVGTAFTSVGRFLKVLGKKMTFQQLGWGRVGNQPSEKQIWDRTVGRVLSSTGRFFMRTWYYIRHPLELIKAIRTGVARMITGIGSGISRLYTGTKTVITRGARTTAGMLFDNRIGQAILRALQVIAMPLSYLVGTIVANPIKSAFFAAGLLLYGLLEDNAFAKTVYDWLIRGAKTLISGLIFFATRILPAALNIGGAMLSAYITYGIKSAIPGMADSAKEGLKSALDAINPAISALGDATKSFFDAILPKHDWSETFGENVMAPLEGFWGDVDENLKQWDTELRGPLNNVRDALLKVDESMGKLYEYFVGIPKNTRTATTVGIMTPSLIVESARQKYASEENQITPEDSAWQRFRKKGVFGLFQKPKEHYTGLSNVPYDNYPALLHKGEEVLTSTQARMRRQEYTHRPTTSSTTTNHYNVENVTISLPNVTQADPDALAQAMKDPRVVLALQQALAKADRQEQMRKRQPLKPNWGLSN